MPKHIKEIEHNGETYYALTILSFNKKKNEWGWKCIEINKSQKHNFLSGIMSKFIKLKNGKILSEF